MVLTTWLSPPAPEGPLQEEMLNDLRRPSVLQLQGIEGRGIDLMRQEGSTKSQRTFWGVNPGGGKWGDTEEGTLK